MTNTYSNYSDILTYNETGAADYSDLLDGFDDAYATLEQDAGYILSQNLQDRSTRAGLSLAAWLPRSMEKQAVEWWQWGTYLLRGVSLSVEPYRLLHGHVPFSLRRLGCPAEGPLVSFRMTLLPFAHC